MSFLSNILWGKTSESGKRKQNEETTDEYEPQSSCECKDTENQTSAGTAFYDGKYNQSTFNIGGSSTTNYYNNNTTRSTQQNIDEADCNLKEVLFNNAEAQSGKVALPINVQLSTAINVVPLQMTSNFDRSLAHLDGEGHYNKRKDFEKILHSRSGSLTLENLFEKAKEKAEADAKSLTNNKTAKVKHIQKHGNMVTLLGQAGIGKSTLACKMLKLILQGELIPGTEYIFFIKLRNLNFNQQLTFLQFALIECSEQWNHDQKTDEMLFIKLKNNQNIVFIFDGVDEADSNQLTKKVTGVLCDKATPDVFFRKILCGDLLPHAKKVVTSRPRQFLELHQDSRPGFVVDILGLDKEGRNALCKQICRDKYEKVKQYLEEHPDVLASCYVPVKCIIISFVLSTAIKDCGDVDVQSLTDIFVQALGYYVSSPHVGDYANEVWKLANLAWHGFSNHKIIFDERDFTTAGMSSKAFGTFLETFVSSGQNNSCRFQFKILDGYKKSSFSHLVWQELFAAIYLMILMSASDFGRYLENVNTSTWEVVSVFMFGLLNRAVLKKIKEILSKRVCEWEEKKKMLTCHLQCILSSVDNDSSSLFQLCTWIHEANSNELNQEILPHLPSIIKIEKVAILPTDAINMTYVLHKANRSFEIVFRRMVTFVHNSFDIFCRGLSTLPIKLKELDLKGNRICDDGAISLTHCLHNIEALDVKSCAITNVGLEAIANKLATLDQPMKCLDLSRNKIGDDGAISLARCLHNIEELHVMKCEITNVGVESITNKLATLDQHKPEVYGLDIQ